MKVYSVYRISLIGKMEVIKIKIEIIVILG